MGSNNELIKKINSNMARNNSKKKNIIKHHKKLLIFFIVFVINWNCRQGKLDRDRQQK